MIYRLIWPELVVPPNIIFYLDLISMKLMGIKIKLKEGFTFLWILFHNLSCQEVYESICETLSE